ncbi:MAG TPA: Rieske 2Fe-2S domain-containing protein [Spirochaetales bacterium]|nr:Rieske 2Fe-2S domain-containing protein [Spirochaetales bacterium]
MTETALRDKGVVQNTFYVPIAKASDIAVGGMIAITLSAQDLQAQNIPEELQKELQNKELIICNVAGKFYALDRRCTHKNAAMEKGTLDGTILTCPAHCAQFDVRTGQALSNPVPLNGSYKRNGIETFEPIESLRPWKIEINGSGLLVLAVQEILE